jgi:hypothetical protein
MALQVVEPAEQVRLVADLLVSAAIRLKRKRIAKSLEKSREIGETAFEISRTSVITVSRGNDLATGETGCDEITPSDGDQLERHTTRTGRGHSGPSDSAIFGQTGSGAGFGGRGTERKALKRRGGDR